MNIEIKRNTFVAPGLSRAEIVQGICDRITQCIGRGFDFVINLETNHPALYLGVRNERYPETERIKYVVGSDSDTRYYDYTRIRSCEMRIAFRLLQEAGYYAYKLDDGWKYFISDRPYLGLRKSERIDFTAFID